MNFNTIGSPDGSEPPPYTPTDAMVGGSGYLSTPSRSQGPAFESNRSGRVSDLVPEAFLTNVSQFRRRTIANNGNISNEDIEGLKTETLKVYKNTTQRPELISSTCLKSMINVLVLLQLNNKRVADIQHICLSTIKASADVLMDDERLSLEDASSFIDLLQKVEIQTPKLNSSMKKFGRNMQNVFADTVGSAAFVAGGAADVVWSGSSAIAGAALSPLVPLGELVPDFFGGGDYNPGKAFNPIEYVKAIREGVEDVNDSARNSISRKIDIEPGLAPIGRKAFQTTRKALKSKRTETESSHSNPKMSEIINSLKLYLETSQTDPSFFY